VYNYEDGTPIDIQGKIEISVDFLASDQQITLINKFIEAVKNGHFSINLIPEGAYAYVKNGYSPVYGLELKNLIGSATFVIDPPGTRYSGKLGKSDYNGGNPIVTLSFDALTLYDVSDSVNGLNHLVLHEISHLAGPIRSYYADLYRDDYTDSEEIQHEQVTDDLAKAIAENAGGKPIATPAYGYGPSITFEQPSGGGGGGGSEPPPPGPGGGHPWAKLEDPSMSEGGLEDAPVASSFPDVAVHWTDIILDSADAGAIFSTPGGEELTLVAQPPSTIAPLDGIVAII
jgi:hypothetical protein